MQPPKKKSGNKRILIAGVSTRALVESAADGHHCVISLDYFGDRDQRDRVAGYSLMRDFNLPCSAENLLNAGRNIDCDAVVYLSNLENHPGILKKLTAGRALLGNAPAVIRRVRDWRVLRKFCSQSGIPFPATLLPGEEIHANREKNWLLKPVRSGGGHGICPWDSRTLRADEILQAYVPGIPASALFAADGKKSVLLGLTEQLIGQQALGVSGQRWCGNLFPLDAPQGDRLFSEIKTAIDAFTRFFGLRGLNGMDFIAGPAQKGLPRYFFLEINPRYTAAMELVEQATGLNLFSVHMDAMEGKLPGDCFLDGITKRYSAKGIVFSRRHLTIGKTGTWADRHRKDIPFSGDKIEPGNPICSVFARGKSRDECQRNLFRRVYRLRLEIGDKTEGLLP